MSTDLVRVMGRYPGMFAPAFIEAGMTVQYREYEDGTLELRLDDDNNPEFWLCISVSSLTELLRAIVASRVDQLFDDVAGGPEETEALKRNLTQKMVYAIDQVTSTAWLKHQLFGTKEDLT